MEAEQEEPCLGPEEEGDSKGPGEEGQEGYEVHREEKADALLREIIMFVGKIRFKFQIIT